MILKIHPRIFINILIINLFKSHYRSLYRFCAKYKTTDNSNLTTINQIINFIRTPDNKRPLYNIRNQIWHTNKTGIINLNVLNDILCCYISSSIAWTVNFFHSLTVRRVYRAHCKFAFYHPLTLALHVSWRP